MRSLRQIMQNQLDELNPINRRNDMYTVLGFSSLDIESGCDCDTETDTLKKAKDIAHHWFTDFEQPMERILIKDAAGVCVLDKY